MSDHLDQRWCCMNCNTTFPVGQMKTGPLYNDPFRCPHCNSGNTHPAEGVVDVPEYFGQIGTKN